MGMLILVLGLNLVISFLNARNVGRVWAETKAIGGWIRVVAWAGAIQSAIGFTYVYAFIVAYIAVSTGLGVAGWNTFATAYNTYNAIQSFGPALDSVQQGLGGLFGGDGDSDDSAARVILLAAIVLLAGVLTTNVIIRRYEASLPVSEEVRNSTRNLEYR